jgi:hypothetical protein
MSEKAVIVCIVYMLDAWLLFNLINIVRILIDMWHEGIEGAVQFICGS